MSDLNPEDSAGSAPGERKGWRDHWDTLTERLKAVGNDREEPSTSVVPEPVGAHAAARGASAPAVTRTPTSAVPSTVSHSALDAAEEAKPRVGAARRTRKARLRLSHLDPWSVMKTSFLFSIAGGIVLIVAVYAVWAVISSSGLFSNVNDIIASVVSTPGDTAPFRVEDYVNTSKVMGVAALLATVDVLIVTALATLGSFLYNLAAMMLGGLEVTLAED